jgi:DNA-directed RNA polymerase specialized sigma24 family protein
VDLDQVDIAVTADDDTVLLISDALNKLATEAPEKAKLIELRFFAGLSIEDAATALRISPATAKRYWAFARAWLFAELSRSA